MDDNFREALILVGGTTPQIITETIYALRFLEEPVFLDEIFVITTKVGREIIEGRLISDGRLEEFFNEFGIKPLTPTFMIVSDSNGKALEDIRTREENEAVGNFVAEFIKEKTEDNSSRLHCSIAGGRKTMSFYLGAALGLFGRPRDRLYHVLVTPEFESHPDFYWKPEKNRILEVSRGGIKKEIDTKDARISLAELPFIRLREKFPLKGESFRELVAEGQMEIDTASTQLSMKVNLADRFLEIGATTIRMRPMQLVIYNAFVREKVKRCRFPDRGYCLDCTECFPYLVDLSGMRVLNEMAEDYSVIYPRNPFRVDEFRKKWKEGVEVPMLRQHISKINSTIRERLNDETLASFYTVTPVGRHGDKRHGVKVEKGEVKGVNPLSPPLVKGEVKGFPLFAKEHPRV